MTDAEIELTFIQLRELRDTELSAKAVADRLESQLRAKGISFQLTPMGYTWERPPPNTSSERGRQ